MSREVEAQTSCSLSHTDKLQSLFSVCSRESYMERSVESVVGNLHGSVIVPCYVICFSIVVARGGCCRVFVSCHMYASFLLERAGDGRGGCS